MKKFGMALLAFLAVNSAFGANWVKIGINASKDMTVYLDIDSVKKIDSPTYIPSNTPNITYYTKYDYSKVQKDSVGNYYNYGVLQNKGDCINNQYMLMGYIEYKENGVVAGSNFRPINYESWKPVSPNSIAELGLHSACYVAGYRSEP